MSGGLVSLLPSVPMGLERKSLFQSVVNRGSAHGPEVFHEVFGFLAVWFGGLHELVKEGLDIGGEAQEFEAVAVVEIFDAELERFFCLVEFFARHRARG